MGHLENFPNDSLVDFNFCTKMKNQCIGSLIADIEVILFGIAALYRNYFRHGSTRKYNGFSIKIYISFKIVQSLLIYVPACYVHVVYQ